MSKSCAEARGGNRGCILASRGGGGAAGHHPPGTGAAQVSLAAPRPVSGWTPLKFQGSLSNGQCKTGQAVVSLSLDPSRQGSGETTVQRSRTVRALGTRAGGLAPEGGGAWGPIGPEEIPSSFLSIYFKGRVTGKQCSICWFTLQTATQPGLGQAPSGALGGCRGPGTCAVSRSPGRCTRTCAQVGRGGLAPQLSW